MRKIKQYILIVAISGILVSAFSARASVVDPNEPCNPVINPTNQPCKQNGLERNSYVLLSPLPNPDGGKLTDFDPGTGFGYYINTMIKIFIGICAVLAVVMIVIGGLEYMTSELVSEKSAGKDKLTGAILGLVIALGAYALLFTINPALLDVSLKNLENQTVTVTQTQQLRQYSGGGSCEPVADASNPCSPANLATRGFGSLGDQASRICNGESRGDPNLPSGVDRCADGNAFSFGLFQVNVIAHQNEIPGGACSGVFQVNGPGTQGACLESRGNICIKRDCRVTNTAKYQSCIAYITNPTNNINYARDLRMSRNWEQWGAYNSCRTSFAAR